MDGGDGLVGLEDVVAPLEVGLVLAGFQDFGVGEVGGVGDQGVAAVGEGIAADGVVVDWASRGAG